MAQLPAPLKEREFILQLFRENLERWFYEPRHWRFALADVKRTAIQFLNFSPPQYDFLIWVTLSNHETLEFYEGIIAKTNVAKSERMHGKIKVGQSTIYFVDGYTNSEYMENLLEAWCHANKLGAIGFVGQFSGVKGKVHVRVKKLQSMGKLGQEVTTNYLYRCSGQVESVGHNLDFDVVAKRFLPRMPLSRGNHEYEMLQALPSNIVPKTRGVAVNRRLRMNSERQVLVLFMDYVEDAVEVGKQIWDLMKLISRKKGLGKKHQSELAHLNNIVQEATNKVVFPFHQAGFKKWHSQGITVKPEDDYFKWYHQELEENLAALEAADIITSNRSDKLAYLFSRAWYQILSDVKATEIHRDLMWRQIIRNGDGGLMILDLDEHIKGHAGKDLADLCAANRFIAEDLQLPNVDYMHSIAKNLNKVILKSYMKSADSVNAVWAEDLEKTVVVYLAYRHLHDAAYYAPAWRQARNAVEQKRYKRYVDFSIEWLEKSSKQLEDMLQEQSVESHSIG